ncbi:FAD-binding domain-containing protein, partial [Aspergillus novofumigatus IBT 16806]
QPCELGNLASYLIDVRSAEDVTGGIMFSREQNIRLVIKNTGHDYAGMSTGKGGLSLWTRNLGSTQFIYTYESSYYNGPAIKLGAGVQGFEAYATANTTGQGFVGGVCHIVAIAGGFGLGGGHSILSNSHGTGSDNVLEWEVVTMDGRHLPEQNSNLYWAPSGSGPGTFTVVLSMTARLHADGIIGGANLRCNWEFYPFT